MFKHLFYVSPQKKYKLQTTLLFALKIRFYFSVCLSIRLGLGVSEVKGESLTCHNRNFLNGSKKVLIRNAMSKHSKQLLKYRRQILHKLI